MAFPTGTTLNTTNLDSDSDDPSLARVDLLATVQAVQSIIDSANINNGVVVANASGKIAVSQLPTTISPTTTLTLAPSTGIVAIQDVLRLTALTSAEILALASAQQGDIAFSADGDSGNPAVCFFDGTNWKYLALSSMTTLT